MYSDNLKRIRKELDIYNVNLNWFVSGKGEMFIGQDKTSTSDADAHRRQVVREYLKECGFNVESLQ